jgi:hypothetical protein
MHRLLDFMEQGGYPFSLALSMPPVDKWLIPFGDGVDNTWQAPVGFTVSFGNHSVSRLPPIGYPASDPPTPQFPPRSRAPVIMTRTSHSRRLQWSFSMVLQPPQQNSRSEPSSINSSGANVMSTAPTAPNQPLLPPQLHTQPGSQPNPPQGQRSHSSRTFNDAHSDA